MSLRPYQSEAIASLYTYFEHNKAEGNPVIAMPTGTGKSHVIGGFIQGIFAYWPTQRVMMLTHVKELIQQNAEKLLMMWPTAPMGIYSAGLRSKQAGYNITFAGIQSAVHAIEAFGKIDIIIIDECHLVSPHENTSYQVLIAALKQVNPKLRVIGLSATPYRLGLGMITDGGIFTDVCYDITGRHAFVRLIDEGYLAPLSAKHTNTGIDTTGVQKRGGEFIEKQLQAATDKEEITRDAIVETLEKAHDRSHILVFATGIEHADNIVDMLHQYGQSAAVIHSKQSAAERDANIKAFKSGELRFLVNNNILTTGFDFAAIDCIVCLRSTASPVLWVQMLGRGTRPIYADGFMLSTVEGRRAAILHGGKQNCLVLDFARNSMRLGPINDPVIPRKKGPGTGEIPIKICETEKLVEGTGCGSYNHISARVCEDCGNEFDFKVKFSSSAATAELVIRDEPIVETFEVDHTVYEVHHKRGGRSSLKVSYHCGIRRFTEWVTAWHTGNVRHRGEHWWKQRTSIGLPDTPEKAVLLSNQLMPPKQIRVWVNQKYPRILSHILENGYDTAKP